MKYFLMTTSATLMLILAGCSTAKEQLGLERRTPDSFAVLTRAPLSLPPDFALRAPEPGAPRPQEITPATTAANVLLGGKPENDVTSKVERDLLEKTAADQADPHIRATINAETAEIIKQDTPTINKLLGRNHPQDAPAPVINPVEEKERLSGSAQQKTAK